MTNKILPIHPQERKKLEAAGWKVGGVREFLELSDTKAQFLEIKLSLVSWRKESIQAKLVLQRSRRGIRGATTRYAIPFERQSSDKWQGNTRQSAFYLLLGIRKAESSCQGLRRSLDSICNDFLPGTREKRIQSGGFRSLIDHK